jgi:hypothetical protein
VFMQSSTCEPSSMFVPYYLPIFSISDIILVSSLDDENEDENSPLPTYLPSIGSIEHDLFPTPSLPRWVHTTRKVVSDIVNDPTYQHQTHSQF